MKRYALCAVLAVVLGCDSKAPSGGGGGGTPAGTPSPVASATASPTSSPVPTGAPTGTPAPTAGPSGTPAATPSPTGAPSPGESKAVVTAGGAAGTVSGTVKLVGKAPKPKKLAALAADSFCGPLWAVVPFAEDVVLGPGQELANVFVHVKRGLGDQPFPISDVPVELDQNKCMYSPHVVGVQVGQVLKVLNSDATLHNVWGQGKINTEFNVGMASGSPPKEFVFKDPEIGFKVICSVHSWMAAYVHIVRHPFFAVTDKGGSFRIKDLPPGEYEVEAWHEKLGTITATVKLGAEAGQTIEFQYAGK